ncbi:Transglutaminase-like enzyme, putative cysteine protease [Nonlabens sp. Hel1_33_55]|uniref:transglutaminase domain-containing protein n=1 Tax=Nonlabens sp. Hel1_33_55 TaxID=1336802 RepID=UPI000875DC4E|nr:transglutaminase family protein [Nonlabens sp. Hel1_33_55]SCX96574.1 Transglutaminase-like enzyme, putative cysteine protease [Nonlabens sp. Hel1_33_55]
MSLKYQIFYQATNTYQSPLKEALWQFLIIPENSKNQNIHNFSFKNSESIAYQESIDGFGNQVLRVSTKKPITKIEFTAEVELEKVKVNPFENIQITNPSDDYKTINDLGFKVEHESFLSPTDQTRIPSAFQDLYVFDTAKTIFDNLLDLNKFLFDYFDFKTEVTDTTTGIDDILQQKQGVCQDFTHVFCGIARLNHIPTRYVSGYLHQNNGLVGDLQMHAWIECFIPENGWVGFDPTNNLLAADNHIKVTHGRDYKDCAPIKGLIYCQGDGTNETVYTVRVKTVEEFEENPIQNKIQFQKQDYGVEQLKQRQIQWQQQQQQ